METFDDSDRPAHGELAREVKTAGDLIWEEGDPELRERLAAIVEFSDDAIISKDLNGIIRSWNRGAERMFGYAAEEAVGQPVSMLAVPEHRDEIPVILERIARGERVDHYLTKRWTKDRRVLSISLTVSPIRNAAGVVVGASKIARDVSEQTRYEQVLRETNAMLQRVNGDLEQFVYAASHDLQEPLRMISTSAEMILRKCGGKLGASGEMYLDYVISGAARMEQLLRGLREFIQASKSGDEAPDVDAAEALHRAVANLASAIEESGASITERPLPWVQMHRFQMELLFQNLIGNAIRYRSREAPLIHIGAERYGSMWRFAVRDNGIGIEPQYREHIFGIFKRLHSAADYPGTGMGLAICQRIIERAGGRMWVESELGQGSTFFFTVPGARGDRAGG